MNLPSSLQSDLAERSARWKEMADADGGNLTRALAYYDTEVFPLVKQSFVARFRRGDRPGVQGLIMPVGTSPEPIILSILALQPQAVVFLPTPQTLQHLKRIIQETDLKPQQYRHETIDGSDVLEIYRKIHHTLLAWKDLASVGIDITAGKKVMSAACAIAGTLRNLRIFYVDNENYLPKYRRPDPGTESLVLLPNPLEVFGDLEEEEARQLFRSGDYRGASERWQHLAERIPDPREATFFASLARAYASWEEMDYEGAASALSAAKQRLLQYASERPALRPHLSLLQDQEAILHTLQSSILALRQDTSLDLDFLRNREAVHTLALDLWAYAERRIFKRQFTMAALILYRIAELLAQGRLATYGIDPSDATYTDLTISTDDLLAAVNRQRSSSKLEQLKELPLKIAFLDGYTLLSALKDPFTHSLNLLRLNGRMKLRNSSIFAHGFKFLQEKSVEDMKQEVFSLLGLFFAAEGRSDLHEALARHRFASLPSL